MIKFLPILFIFISTAVLAEQEFYVKVDDHVSVKVATTDDPVVIEEIRVLPKGSLTTEHQHVVRQGDKVLLIVRPQRNQGDIEHD